MSKKIGFCISVYDKYEEARILIELLRQYSVVNEIILIRNDAANQQEFKKYNFEKLCDRIIGNSKYKYVKDNQFLSEVSITARIWESQKCGLLCAAENNDYVIHTHADGWILKEDFLFRIINEFEKNRFEFGFRGPGLSYRNSKGELLGKLDDHYYILDSTKIKTSIFLKKDILQLPIDCLNIHGILAFWVTAEFDINKTWHYDDFRNVVNWKGQQILIKNELPMLRPLHYVEKESIIHIHRSDFIVERFGKELQAYYLKNNAEIAKNSYSEYFISKYYRDIELIRKDIFKLIKFKLWFIRILGINDQYHHNNPILITNYYKIAIKNPFMVIKLNLSKILYSKSRFFNKNSIYPVGFKDRMELFHSVIKR